MTDVDMGLNVYEFNKSVMKQLPIIEGEGLEKVLNTLEEYAMNIEADQYLMMLCREKNDYTLFNFNSNWDEDTFAKDVIECMENRGYGIVNCEVIDNGIVKDLISIESGNVDLIGSVICIGEECFYVISSDDYQEAILKLKK